MITQAEIEREIERMRVVDMPPGFAKAVRNTLRWILELEPHSPVDRVLRSHRLPMVPLERVE